MQLGPDTNSVQVQALSGYHLHASEAPFKWRFAGGPMMARIYCYM